jgi:hypothetical protein
MNFRISATVDTCFGTTRKKLFGTLGTKQLRATSFRVVLLRTPRKILCTYQIQIHKCAKVLEEEED